MNDNVKDILNAIVEQFRTGNIPEVIALAMFPFPDIPSSHWSLLNRTIMLLSGTADARGYRQWKQVNRFVKKGSKSVHILVPLLHQIRDEGGPDKLLLKGFAARPVFRVEDTEGEALEYQQISLPDLPLREKAEEWGITIRSALGPSGYYGAYSPHRREIVLAGPEECVFFHELAHAAHERVLGEIKGGQDAFQEIVAELSAAVLCRIVGKNFDTLGNSYEYIDSYATKLKMSVPTACMKVFAEVEDVLNLILSKSGTSTFEVLTPNQIVCGQNRCAR